MNTIRQSFFNQLSTSRASLACVARINERHGSAGACCLVSRELHELSPGCFSNGFSDAFKSILPHIFNVQFFKGDDLIGLNQFTRKFMCKILTFIDDSLVNMGDGFFSLLSFKAAILFLRKFALRFCQGFFFCFEKAGILNFLTGRKSGKRRKANINTNHRINFRQWTNFNFTGKTSIPFARRSPANSQGFNGSFNIPMLSNLNGTNLRQLKPVINKTKSALREGETIISVKSFKSWITRLFARFHSAKESLECKINTKLGILETLGKCVGKIGFIFLPLNQKVAGIIQRQRFLFFFPHFFTDCKGLIIGPATSIKRRLQRFFLFGRRIETIFKSLTHGNILNTINLNIKNYFTERTAIHPPDKSGSLLADFL